MKPLTRLRGHAASNLLKVHRLSPLNRPVQEGSDAVITLPMKQGLPLNNGSAAGASVAGSKPVPLTPIAGGLAIGITDIGARRPQEG
ncbi:hypothetical protein [Streptomyces sirii]|uniref:hypothetical protein n=1 Tax=Streptomyces sirii TaxID=3127701 RepID=UPI003D35CC35